MIRSRGSQLRISCQSLLVVFTLFASVAQAQTAPTAEQLQLFNQLDPSQQQSILQSIGQASGSSLSGQTSTQINLGNTIEGQLEANPSSFGNIGYGRIGSSVLAGKRDVKGVSPEVITLKGEDTVLVDIERLSDKQELHSQEQYMNELINLIRSKNPYLLTRDGSLQLPGFKSIPLSGLTIEQASSRVAADPALRDLKVKLSLLPLDKSGVAGLSPYGYDLFNGSASTFAPVTDVPVTDDYVLGTGDELTVQLYGNTNRTFKLVVGRDGRINFPALGPISVAGQNFSVVQASLEARVSRQMIGTNASISMGATRSIRVFVLGEANQPGSYTVSGLSTMTTALFVSGGVKTIGSLRTVQLKRQGAVVRTLDLYDLLMKGDTSGDARLMQGDVIYIPTVGATVAVQGEVKRPGIYELKGNQTAKDAISLAGGLTADADLSKVSLVRINKQGQRSAMDVSLNVAARAATVLNNGDVLSVARVSPALESGITIEGHLYAPRTVAWRSGLRLTDVIHSVDELKPNADIHYLLIRREMIPDRRITILSADLASALAERGGVADIVLQARDQITVFDAEADRSRVIDPILKDLRLQSHAGRSAEVVGVIGRIKMPGDYPLEPGMRVSDLLRAGGSLQDSAFTSSAELTRYSDADGKRTTELITVDLAAIFRGDAAADIKLQPSDLLTIKELPLWSKREQVTLNGEVRFPGVYSIQRGETLRSLIQRAGGLSDMAFTEGSVFTREDLKLQEQQQLDLLATRMQSDLTTLSLQSAQTNQAGASQTLAIGQQLMSQLKNTKSVGRLVIDLGKVMSGEPGSDSDVILKDGDTLIVPRQRQEVSVIGEVQAPTSHLYGKGISLAEYVTKSGGMTRKADEKRIYVVRANGAVVVNSGSAWTRRGTEMKPGDTIVVPMDTDHVPTLPLWQAVTQIIYNVAIAAAAVHSF